MPILTALFGFVCQQPPILSASTTSESHRPPLPPRLLQNRNARCTRHSGYQSQAWRLRKRNSPQGPSRRRTKPNSPSSNSSPGPTPAQQLWTIYTPDNREEQVHRVWQGSRYHFRVWSLKSTSVSMVSILTHSPHTHSVPIPNQGSAWRAARRTQSFLVDKTRCVHCPFPLLLDTLVGATIID